MAIAPEPYLTACLKVIERALVAARMLGWSGERLPTGISQEDARQLADLMDAVHNIPSLLVRWERCDEELLRSYLQNHDEKWALRGGSRLLDIYQQALAGDRFR